ncbi:hypothetical protein ACH3VR_07935 [Microbacterium sp. B2969]|uniref:NADH:ubiquinone oxidoreductase n=1 Tax=Microbacterium alkaliflavum TaxID=3248839 RepID=A0ABW7Q5Z3_9MICO
MRKYLFGTGLFGVILGGVGLLRAVRGNAPFTWRVALAFVSWAISLTLAIGTIIDIGRAERGHVVDPDSPIAGQEERLLQKRLVRKRRLYGQ